MISTGLTSRRLAPGNKVTLRLDTPVTAPLAPGQTPRGFWVGASVPPQSRLRRQKPSLGSREHKLRGRMPLFLVVIPPSFRVWRLLLWLHNKLNAFTRVAHKTSEQPKKHTD